MPREWNKEQFLARVADRISELGKPEATLLRDKGFQVDLIRKDREYAWRIDKIAEIGIALDWDLAEVLGLDVDPDLLRQALSVAESEVPEGGRDRLAEIAKIAAWVYGALAKGHDAETLAKELLKGQRASWIPRTPRNTANRDRKTRRPRRIPEAGIEPAGE